MSRLLANGRRLVDERRHFGRLSQSGVAWRFGQALRSFVSAPLPRIPSGPYALVVDGVYFRFNRKEWVLYILAVKPVHSHRMFFLDPVLLPGRERLEAWNEAIATIPPRVRGRVRALVSDGLRGFQQLAAVHSWAHQRCHFHLLASLVRGKGKRRYATRGGTVRSSVLKAVRVMLADRPKRGRDAARRAVRRYARHSACPGYIRKHLVEFLEREGDFRAYLRHPELNLPTTTNAVESTGRLVRKATRTARTPRSVQLRATAFLRLKRTVACNGARTQN